MIEMLPVITRNLVRRAIPVVPYALTVPFHGSVAAKWVSTGTHSKVKTNLGTLGDFAAQRRTEDIGGAQDNLESESHYEEHWTYPLSYPTKEQLDEVKALQEDKEHHEEHWTYPVSYPTEQQLEELKELRAKAHGEVGPGQEPMDEHWGQPILYPSAQEVDEMLKLAKEDNDQKKSRQLEEENIRRHAWE